MATSAEIALLHKIALLAERYGLKPSEADAAVGEITLSDGMTERYRLEFLDSTPPEKDAQMDKMCQALGADKRFVMAQTFGELEDIVDRALALAPRARTR